MIGNIGNGRKRRLHFAPCSGRSQLLCLRAGKSVRSANAVLCRRNEVVSWLTVPDHLRGWSTMVHGGIISTILDEIMSWTAIHQLKKIIVTKSMTVEFKKPIHIGQQIKAEGRILNIINRKEALMEGRLSNHNGELCASATGSFALLKPDVAERLGIVDTKDMDYISDE